MPFHICMDEIRLLLLAIPIFPAAWFSIKLFLWRFRTPKTTCCDHKHDKVKP